MISTLILSVSPLVCPLPAPASAAPVPVVQDETDVQKRIEAAGKDVAKLLALAEELKAADRAADARTVMKAVLEIDPDNEEAHTALRHHRYDGKWFESYAALAKYRREEAARMKEEHGLVRFKDEWVPEADVPFLRMGWVQDEQGAWVSQRELERRAQAAKHQAEGWKLQDATWIPPDEVARMEEGLYKCGDEWLPVEKANAYHAEIGRWWEVPSQRGQFVVLTTVDRKRVEWATWYADQTYAHLIRLFGLRPASPPYVVVLNGNAQYNAFANGDPELGLPPTEASGFSSLHYSFFAETFFDPTVSPPEYVGSGVAYWAAEGDQWSPWGQYAIRHAAAHSYVEAIDPSWNAVSTMIESAMNGSPSGFDEGRFWEEKRIPRWMRYGAASYVERFLQDDSAGQNGGDPWQYRNFAMGQVREAGGLRDLDELFAFQLTLDKIDDSTRMIHEAGLIVSFILDGNCGPVRQAHARWKAALKSGEKLPEARQALEQAVKDHMDDLRLYANL